MPSLQAVATDGRVIATLGDVSQHTETLGFNPDPGAARLDQLRLAALLPHRARAALRRRRHRDGRLGREQRDAPGVPGPDLARAAAVRRRLPSGRMPDPVRRQRRDRADRLSTRRRRCWASSWRRSVGDALEQFGRRGRRPNTHLGRAPVGLHRAHQRAVHAGRAARRLRRSIRVHRQLHRRDPARPNGSDERRRAPVTSRGVPHRRRRVRRPCPARSFPFTYPPELPRPAGHAAPAVPAPAVGDRRTCTRRTASSTGSPRTCSATSSREANGVGVPGEPDSNSDVDRFGCGHSDDSEATSSQTADIVGTRWSPVLDHAGGAPEHITRRPLRAARRRALPRSAGPTGLDQVQRRHGLHRVGRPGGRRLDPRRTVGRVVVPAAWMSLSGRPQARPDRNTRGWIGRTANATGSTSSPTSPERRHRSSVPLARPLKPPLSWTLRRHHAEWADFPLYASNPDIRQRPSTGNH